MYIRIVVFLVLSVLISSAFAQQSSKKFARLEREVAALATENATLMARVSAAEERARSDAQTIRSLADPSPKWTDYGGLIFGLSAFVVSVLALFVSQRSAWFTGSMETHSQIALELEAMKNKVELRWWDPQYAGPKKTYPPSKKQHDQPFERKVVYVFVPTRERKKHSMLEYVKAWWDGHNPDPPPASSQDKTEPRM